MNLIIGGSGFVGSYLISKLDNKETLNMEKNDNPFLMKLLSIVIFVI